MPLSKGEQTDVSDTGETERKKANRRTPLRFVPRNGANNERLRVSISNVCLSTLQVEPRPLLLHLGLPLPRQRVLALAARPADALVNPAQLECAPRLLGNSEHVSGFESY